MITLKNWHERMAQDMRLRDYSRKTQEAYAREARHFLKHVGKEPRELVEEDLRAYFIYLKEERKLAPSSRNIAVHGLRFFFQHTLQQEWPIFELVRVNNPQNYRRC
jgi:site-specific recombinase XerD